MCVTVVNKRAPDLKEIPERVIAGFQIIMDGTEEERWSLENVIRSLILVKRQWDLYQASTNIILLLLLGCSSRLKSTNNLLLETFHWNLERVFLVLSGYAL